MNRLSRNFGGTINLKKQPVHVSLRTIGDVESPSLIVTSLKYEIGIILKPSLNGDGWYMIDKTSQELSADARRELERELNTVIDERGAPESCILGLCTLE